MPFVKHPLAESLSELVDGIAILGADELEALTDPVAAKARKQAARSRSPHAAALHGSGVYMQSKRAKKFLYRGVNHRYVWQCRGTRQPPTYETTQRFPTAAKALEAAIAILDERVSVGFEITTD